MAYSSPSQGPLRNSKASAQTQRREFNLWNTASLVYPRTDKSYRLKRLKYIVRGFWHFAETSAWLSLLEKAPLRELSKRHPRIFSKIQRRYLTATLRPKTRLRAVESHYAFLATSVDPHIVDSIYSEEGLSLATLSLEGLPPLSLRLFYSDGFEKEGEIGIGLFNDSLNVALFHLAFTAWKTSASGWEFFIGGLQGQKYFNDREFIVQLTRTMHGLRPKSLLLFVLQTLAARWEVAEIRAVSAEMHVYQHWQQRKTIHADYNEFWEENGGQRMSDGMYQLPARATERDPESIPSKKRSQYRKRYTMLAALAQNIFHRLDGHPVPLTATPGSQSQSEVKRHLTPQ